MRYAIITVDDSRAEFKAKIRSEMGADEVFPECLDARAPGVDVTAELGALGLRSVKPWIAFYPTQGDLAAYVGHYNAWKLCAESDEPLMVFEDDAAVPDGFADTAASLVSEVPGGYGAIGFCAHPQDQLYGFACSYDEYGRLSAMRPLDEGEPNPHDYGAPRMARSYQNWAATCTLYSPEGAAALVRSSLERGIHMNADALIWHRSHAGDFPSYAPKPEFLPVPFYMGHSIIQGAERGARGV